MAQYEKDFRPLCSPLVREIPILRDLSPIHHSCTMIFLLCFALPLMAAGLWMPLKELSLRTRFAAVVISTLLGVTPVVALLGLRKEMGPAAMWEHVQLFGGAILFLMLCTSLFLLIRDGVRGYVALTYAQSPRIPWARITQVFLLATSLLAGVGLYFGTQAPQVREQTIAMKHLPPELDGFRIAVIADLHATAINNQNYVAEVVRRTNAAKPDTIVLPGDLVDGPASTNAKYLQPLKQLRAPYGVWAAPGNHEYYSGYAAWARVYDTLGFKYLQNEVALITHKGKTMAIAGVGDITYGNIPLREQSTPVEGIPPNLAKVSEEAKAAGADTRILLAHQPKSAPDNAGLGFDLQISGHTHGGHVRGMDQWLIAPANRGYVRGTYAVGPMALFVSSGAGLWPGFAIRLGVPSAIDVLTLTKG